MKNITLFFLIALLVAGAAYECAREQEQTPAPVAQEPEQESATCVAVEQHVNAVYESAYRGESYLGRGAIAHLHRLECLVCGPGSWACAQVEREGVPRAGSP